MVEHLFRHEAGKIVATLTRSSAGTHLTLAADVVPDALARALRTWPFLRRCRKIPPPGSCGLRAISRSMSYGASQSGIMGEGEHVKPSSHLA